MVESYLTKTDNWIDTGQLKLSNSKHLRVLSQAATYETERSRTLARLGGILCRFRPLRNMFIRWICHYEGGQIWSTSFRELMTKYYDVIIGRYSYGPCLWPGELPRKTQVGNFCSFAPGVKVFRRNHPVTFVSLHPFFFNSRLEILDRDTIEAVENNPLHIMDDVWIGADAIITPRCHRIGIGAVVGAGAVVVGDVPDFTIVAGNPAQLIRKRFNDEICEILLDLRWWAYRLDQLLPLLPLFVGEVTFENIQLLREHLRNQFPK
ncbi:MAG: hypothetical protein FJ115_00290 [Deltaproteobacteria bacterium]|nr:hypothetical protein [Deltaproteobacteria bacterium]MBM4321968.1 hypothetical protein [Deltaproteobacteria bacterium]